jgi:hypothetical protein
MPHTAKCFRVCARARLGTGLEIPRDSLGSEVAICRAEREDFVWKGQHFSTSLEPNK